MRTLQDLAILLVFVIQTVLSEPRWYTARDGAQYLIETQYEYNWYQAWHECALQNAHLIAIDTEEKNDIIKHLLEDEFFTTYNLWIGGNDAYGDRPDQLRPFYWSATGEEFSFTNWAGNQPDNYRFKEHCVHIMHDALPAYGWNDNSCHNADMGYICEGKSFAIDHFKKSNYKLKDGGNEEDIKQEPQKDINQKGVEQQHTDEKNITPDSEDGYIKHQTEGEIIIKTSENSVTVDGTNLVLNNRNWKDIIKSSLQKTELDIFGSLFSLEREVDNVTGEEK